MLNRAAVVGVAASLAVAITTAGCGSDTPTSNPAAPPASQGVPGSTGDAAAADASGLTGITFPPGAGYVRAQEASASRFCDKGTKRIQITWPDQQGTIRGVVRVTRG